MTDSSNPGTASPPPGEVPAERPASLTGAWEKSPDGARWEHDFDLTYTKIR
jgi:hypothetical protein